MRSFRTHAEKAVYVTDSSRSSHPTLPPLAAALALTAGLGLAPVLAGDTAAMQAFVVSGALDFVNDPLVIAAIQEQNAANAGLTQDDIDALDQAWRAEVGTADTPTIDAVLDTAASDYLRAQVEAGMGKFTEVFVMDALGLNVASATTTSDYWQGDEAKFSETYPNGPDAMHFGEIEKDESTGTYQAQISLTLVDPASGEPIGAVTVGVNAEALF